MLTLISAAYGAVVGNLKDQFKDAVSCEGMEDNILMMRKTSSSGVLSNGSSIIVRPGQIAVIMSGGRIVDVSAEEGVYKYTQGAPSFFAGDFGASFKDMWTRFTYGGGRPIQDGIYYINSKEIMNNGFGTQNPVYFNDWQHAVMNARMGTMDPMRVDVRCNGKYTFKISDPATFLREVAGTVDIYEKEMLCDQMRSEITEVLQMVLNILGSSEYKVLVGDLPAKTQLIKQIMAENDFDVAIKRRGIKIVSMSLASITLTDESKEKIDSYELGGDMLQAQGTMVNAYAQAMVDAANNSNGAATGFVGMGMANGMGGGALNPMMMMNMQNQQNMQMMQQQNVQNMQNQGMMVPGMQPQQMMQPGMQQMGQSMGQPMAQPALHTPAGATCPKCGAAVAGKFCGECGTKIEVPTKKFCTTCGKEVTGKFCGECGTPVQ